MPRPRSTLVTPAVWFLLLLTGVGCAGPRNQVDYGTDLQRMTITTEPSGATVTQIMPPTDARVVIGQTPLNRQLIATLTRFKAGGMSPQQVASLHAQLGSARLEITKPGYQPVVGNFSGAIDEDGIAEHHVQLQPLPQTQSRTPQTP